MRPLIYALVIAGIAMVFALQNASEVDVRFLGWDVTMSQALLIILTLIIGVIIGMLALTKSLWNKRSEMKKQKKLINALEKQIVEITQKIPVTIPPTTPNQPGEESTQPPITPV